MASTKHVGSNWLENALHPQTWNLLIKHMTIQIEQSGIEFDTIAFRGTSGTLIAPALAGTLNKEMLLIRKDGEKNGCYYKLEGNGEPTNYIIVDDLIDSGSTVQKIIDGVGFNSKTAKCKGIFLYHNSFQISQDCREHGLDVSIPVHSLVMFKNVTEPGSYNVITKRGTTMVKPQTNPSVFKRILAFLGCFLLFGLIAQAATPAFTPDNIEKAIVGEAANQGYTGMLAVACAIRNRGTLEGVYGLEHNPSWMYNQPMYVWKRAARAWQESAKHDITGGAQYWEGTAFKRPRWSYGMTVTLRYKQQIFFRDNHYKKP